MSHPALDESNQQLVGQYLHKLISIIKLTTFLAKLSLHAARYG